MLRNIIKRPGKIPIRSETAFSSLLLRGKLRAEGAEQVSDERTAAEGYLSRELTCNPKEGDRSLLEIK